MARLIWTQEAVRWLGSIFDYIATENPVAARRVVTDIYEKVAVLKIFGGIGYRYELDQEGDEVRILLYGHYRIAYLVKKDVIEILGVFHGAMEIKKYLSLEKRIAEEAPTKKSVKQGGN
jgi:toxin ParE1/3/4